MSNCGSLMSARSSNTCLWLKDSISRLVNANITNSFDRSTRGIKLLELTKVQYSKQDLQKRQLRFQMTEPQLHSRKRGSMLNDAGLTDT